MIDSKLVPITNKAIMQLSETLVKTCSNQLQSIHIKLSSHFQSSQTSYQNSLVHPPIIFAGQEILPVPQQIESIMEETVISEGTTQSEQIPTILAEYQSIAQKLYLSKQSESALDALSQSEELLEAVRTQGGSTDPRHILMTLHNSALCYLQQSLYRLGQSKECLTYLESCLFSNDLLKSGNSNDQGWKLRYNCKVSLQQVSLYSSLENQEKTLESARMAVESIQGLLELCRANCLEHIQRHQQFTGSKSMKKRIDSHRQYKLMESPHYIHYHEQVSKALPVCEYLLRAMQGRVQAKTFGLRALLQSENDSESSLDLKWLSSTDNQGGIQTELTRDFMNEKVYMCVAALFRLAQSLKSVDKVHSAKLYQSAASIGQALLRKDSKLLGMVLDSTCPRFKLRNPSLRRQRILIVNSRTKSPLLPQRRRSTSNKKHSKLVKSMKNNLSLKKCSRRRLLESAKDMRFLESPLRKTCNIKRN